MPVATELRAVWDAMRPKYQALLGGGVASPGSRRQCMRDALEKIEPMHREFKPRLKDGRFAMAWICSTRCLASLAAKQLSAFSSPTGDVIRPATFSSSRPLPRSLP